jgi:tripartite-type tricarboxylate transporter receptor subunit TctC
MKNLQLLSRTAVVSALAVVSLLAPSLTAAQDYPMRSVRIVVPFGAGGSADVYARHLAQRLSLSLKQSFVVENRTGAGGIIGTDSVAKSAPDGYTILVITNHHAIHESLTPNKPFQLMRDFVPVAPVNYADQVLVVHPSVPANDVKELIALAKKNPGRLNYASSGMGSPYHMAAELFKAMAGIDIVHIPHKASGEMRSAVIGGHVQLGFDAVSTMLANVQSGQVRALGTTSTKRSSALPNVPTIDEGGLPGYESPIWIGLMAPIGTPRAIVDKLNAEIAKAIDRPEVKAEWGKQGVVAMMMSPSEFDAYIRKEIQGWEKVVGAANLKPQQ